MFCLNVWVYFKTIMKKINLYNQIVKFVKELEKKKECEK